MLIPSSNTLTPCSSLPKVLLEYSSFRVDRDGVGDKEAKGGLYDCNRGIRSEQDHDIGPVLSQLLRRTCD